MTGQQPVRVLVVDDQQLMREGIASLLSIQEGIEIAGTAADGQEAIYQAVALLPDVILMDIRMPIMDGMAATEKVRAELPNCQVIILTTFDDDEYIVKSLLAGACGYLLKDIPAQDLAHAIQLAHKGIYQLEPSIAGKLIGVLSSGRTPVESKPAASASLQDDCFDLTERELDVLRLIATGATNKEIAQELFISEGTVKNHVSNILNCLGLRDRTQAAIYAREKNLI
jgi:DNA-binding NarL/FixJ family response regulator